MRAADTSAVVAAFASWHEKHTVARRALDGGLLLVAHCALETYSVLTRLPPPHRVAGEVVRDFLAERFPRSFLRLSAREYRDFILGLANRAVSGGGAYDALVAATVARAGGDLVSCDLRALPIYEQYGVRVHLL